MDQEEITDFARTFREFLVAMREAADTETGSPLRDVLDAHLGRESHERPIVRDSYPPFEHVNVQSALDALLSESGTTHELKGLLGEHHFHMSFGDLIQGSHLRGIALGAVDYVSLADGFASVRPCVQAGLYLVTRDDLSFAVLLRGPSDNSPRTSVTLEILSAARAEAEDLLASLRRLALERSVFRHQVLTFGG